MKEEALKLADEIEVLATPPIEFMDTWLEASAMIRRLVEELDKQGEPVAWRVAFREAPDSKIEYALDCASDGKEYLLDRVRDCDLAWIGTPEPLYTTPQTKPLTNDEADKVAEMMADMYNNLRAKEKGSRGYSEQCYTMKVIYRAIEAKVREEK